MVSTSLVCFRRVNSNFFVVNMSFLRVKYHFLGGNSNLYDIYLENGSKFCYFDSISCTQKSTQKFGGLGIYDYLCTQNKSF